MYIEKLPTTNCSDHRDVSPQGKILKKEIKREYMLLSILLMARCNMHDSEPKVIIMLIKKRAHKNTMQ